MPNYGSGAPVAAARTIPATADGLPTLSVQQARDLASALTSPDSTLQLTAAQLDFVTALVSEAEALVTALPGSQADSGAEQHR